MPDNTTSPAPEDRLEIRIEDTVFHLAGDLDPHTSPHLQDVVDGALGDDADHAVFAVSDLGFVDSAGLRVIADTHRRLAAAGGGLTLRSPSASLQKLLSVTGLDDHVTVEA